WAGALDARIPKIVIGVDNHVRTYTRPHFSAYFLAHRRVSCQPFDHQTVYLPCGYDPVHFYASSIPWGERAYDAALVGIPYPQRVEVVRRLRAAGLKVFAAAGLLYDQYRAAYHQSRLSLCVSLCGDVGQRVFETAALGCAVISDACPDFELLQPRGITVALEMDTLVEAARARLAQPPDSAALDWVRAHTWDARAETVLEHLGALAFVN
ncbi:MAG: glycosyltransferase, partial [Anaerolineae bacterium]|nr:glycosyltransferase [Anaerolineae bacterium]